MNIDVRQKPLGAVLFQYDIYPEKIENVGKVTRIFTANGQYALKETTMNDEEAHWFVHVMRRLEKIGFHYAVPVLPTKYGDYIVRNGGQTFYLMPWYEDHQQFRSPVYPEEVMAEELAKLHGLTERTQDYSETVLEKSFETLKKRWAYRKLEMERYADKIESNVYLSPFELTFLTHFQRSIFMADKAEEHLTLWYEGVKEKRASAVFSAMVNQRESIRVLTSMELPISSILKRRFWIHQQETWLICSGTFLCQDHGMNRKGGTGRKYMRNILLCTRKKGICL